MKHTKLFILIATLSLLLCACSSTPTSKQTRNDLTSEHFNGLSADMNRSDVEDLIGKVILPSLKMKVLKCTASLTAQSPC